MAESTHSKSDEESKTQPPYPFFGLSEEEIIETVLSQHKPSRNPFVRGVWITVGSIGVLFAIIGIFLPGWPTTSWLVLSAYCYARSSKKMFKWLLTNPLRYFHLRFRFRYGGHGSLPTSKPLMRA